MEFRDLTKKDAQICLATELDKLKKTIPDVQREVHCNKNDELERRAASKLEVQFFVHLYFLCFLHFFANLHFVQNLCKIWSM